MPCMITRPGITRHAYSAQAPGMVVAAGVTALVPGPMAGRTSYPLSQPVASFAADGAPYYNSGYLPGYPSAAVLLPGGSVQALSLPPRAAQVDLTDRQSWDRPVYFPGSR